MKNLEKHLRYEVDLEKYEAKKKREIECGKENGEGGQVEGLGQLKGTIPAREYFRWHQDKQGCWGGGIKAFTNEFFRDNPHLKAKSFTKKTFVSGGFTKPKLRMRKIAVSTMVTNLVSMVGVDSFLTAESTAAVRSFNRFGKLAWDRTAWPFQFSH